MRCSLYTFDRVLRIWRPEKISAHDVVLPLSVEISMGAIRLGGIGSGIGSQSAAERGDLEAKSFS